MHPLSLNDRIQVIFGVGRWIFSEGRTFEQVAFPRVCQTWAILFGPNNVSKMTLVAETYICCLCK